MKEILEYTAIIEREQDEKYFVSFPSLPGCVTFGNDLEHAKKMAQEALDLWLQELQDKKEPIPKEERIINKYIIKLRVAVDSKYLEHN